MRVLLMAGIVLFSMAAYSSDLPSEQNPPEQQPIESTKDYRNTYYYLILEDKYAGQPKTEKIYDMNDKVLVMVSPKYKTDLTMEGSGKLIDGRVLNWAGKKDGTHRFRFTKNSWGDGVGTCPLVPFKTIAVDPKKISLGTLVRIKESIGMKLPSGEIHDGYWRADDIGGAIKEDRIDIFIGQKSWEQTLAKHGITHLKPLTVEVIETPEPGNCALQK
jgi:3D (Asp-Asp-Asp) domain-containing protein